MRSGFLPAESSSPDWRDGACLAVFAPRPTRLHADPLSECDVAAAHNLVFRAQLLSAAHSRASATAPSRRKSNISTAFGVSHAVSGVGAGRANEAPWPGRSVAHLSSLPRLPRFGRDSQSLAPHTTPAGSVTVRELVLAHRPARRASTTPCIPRPWSAAASCVGPASTQKVETKMTTRSHHLFCACGPCPVVMPPLANAWAAEILIRQMQVESSRSGSASYIRELRRFHLAHVPENFWPYFGRILCSCRMMRQHVRSASSRHCLGPGSWLDLGFYAGCTLCSPFACWGC